MTTSQKAFLKNCNYHHTTEPEQSPTSCEILLEVLSQMSCFPASVPPPPPRRLGSQEQQEALGTRSLQLGVLLWLLLLWLWHWLSHHFFSTMAPVMLAPAHPAKRLYKQVALHSMAQVPDDLDVPCVCETVPRRWPRI